uniref:Uncharacterized protein n=1 Tax=Lotharella globosa TaxID=91324 RepID=A0A7S3Z9H7_9EUKA|mmetsp:Transcript_22577/g.45343  ORF Transcript_22577/g.45343 Transcript_22577/m.45343 type:complete len:448 (+) Transcript_22577:33-1376(+)
MPCFSVAWVVSDTLKATASISQVFLAIYQLQHAQELWPKQIEALALSAAVVSFVFAIGAHEPGYFGWQPYVSLVNIQVAILMISGSYISYRVTYAHYFSCRLEVPKNTVRFFRICVPLASGLVLVSLIGSVVANRIAWAGFRLFAVAFNVLAIGIPFIYSLSTLHAKFVIVTRNTSGGMEDRKHCRSTRSSKRFANPLPANSRAGSRFPAPTLEKMRSAEAKSSRPGSALEKMDSFEPKPSHRRVGSGLPSLDKAHSGESRSPINRTIEKGESANSVLDRLNSTPDSKISQESRKHTPKMSSLDIGAQSSVQRSPRAQKGLRSTASPEVQSHLASINSTREHGKSTQSVGGQSSPTFYRTTSVPMEAMQKTRKWIRKLRIILICAYIFVFVVTVASLASSAIFLTSDEKYSDRVKEEACKYDPIRDILFWIAVMVNFFYGYYTSGTH